MITIYEKFPGKWVALKSGTFSKPFFFHANFRNLFTKYRQWFLWFNIGLFHFWKDNCNLYFGFSFWKKHYSIHFHR